MKADESVVRKIGYTDKVIEHFKNPRNIGKLENPDATAKVGSVACGDLIKLYMKVDEESKKIKDLTFESYGCAANIATSSVMTELAKGKTLEEAKKITFHEIAEELGGLPKIKLHCSVLSKQSLDAVILKYEVKKGAVKIDELLVTRILRGVLDPVEGVDIIAAKMVREIKVEDKKVTIKLNVKKGSELAKSIEGDIHEAFEGLNLDLNLVFED